jgi:AcrR family transcriptional regulator
MSSHSKDHRADKKQRTRDYILANAIALFRTQGIRRTRLSEVADRSDISPATLFNYYPAKGALAEAWVRGEVERMLSEAISETGGRDRSLRSAIRSGCRRVASLSSEEPRSRFEAWRETGRAAGGGGSDRSALVAGLRNEQVRERVRGDLSAEELAGMLLDAIEGGLIAGLRKQVDGHADGLDESGIEAELSACIQRRVDLVLDGARKRNERVSASGLAGRVTRPAPNT